MIKMINKNPIFMVKIFKFFQGQYLEENFLMMTILLVVLVKFREQPKIHRVS